MYVPDLIKNKEKIKKEFTESFNYMRNMAELKALIKVSLERPLTDREYKRIMALKEKVL